MAKRKKNSTNNINRKFLNDFCGLSYAMDIIGGRWKLMILYKLENKKLRYSALKAEIPRITERMLSRQLKELHADQLIARTPYAEIPPRVEYELTEAGHSLSPIWKDLEQWGLKHRDLAESDD